jgi:hypothetical protein
MPGTVFKREAEALGYVSMRIMDKRAQQVYVFQAGFSHMDIRIRHIGQGCSAARGRRSSVKNTMSVSVSLPRIFIIQILCPSFLCQGIMQFVRMVPAVVFDLAGFLMGLAVGKP